MMSDQSPSQNPMDKLFDEGFLKAYRPYLDEFQTGLIQAGLVFLVAAVYGFFKYREILTKMMSIFQLEGINIVLTSPYQFIDLAVSTALIVGFLAAAPILAYHLFRFVKPALKPKEYAILKTLFPISLALFIAGFFFGVWVIQFVINVFSETSTGFDVSNFWDISNFFSQILITGIALAFIFQLPIVITLLIRLHLVTYEMIASKRRYIYIAVLLFAALLPPTDLVSLALLAIIPLFLIEITLLFNKP